MWFSLPSDVFRASWNATKISFRFRAEHKVDAILRIEKSQSNFRTAFVNQNFCLPLTYAFLISLLYKVVFL